MKLISASKARWLCIAIAAIVVAVWPGGGTGGQWSSGLTGAPASAQPSREEAVDAAAPHSPAVAEAAGRVIQARAAVDELQQQLNELRVSAFRGSPDALPAAAADELAQAREQRYAEEAARAFSARLAGAQRELDAAEEEQRHALADYFATLAAAAAEEAERLAGEEAARNEAARNDAARNEAARDEVAAGSAVAAPARPSTGTCAGELACFLACTRAHESDTAGGYQAVSPDGVYRGAYQFDQTTWNSVAGSIGRGDLVGVNPAAASPADQDTLATALYEMRGNQPWGGRC